MHIVIRLKMCKLIQNFTSCTSLFEGVAVHSPIHPPPHTHYVIHVSSCENLVSVYIKSTSTNLSQYLPLISTLTKVKAVSIVTDVTEIPEGCQTTKINEYLWLAVKVGVIAYLSRLMTKPTKWHVHTAKTQISLGISPV